MTTSASLTPTSDAPCHLIRTTTIPDFQDLPAKLAAAAARTWIEAPYEEQLAHPGSTCGRVRTRRSGVSGNTALHDDGRQPTLRYKGILTSHEVTNGGVAVASRFTASGAIADKGTFKDYRTQKGTTIRIRRVTVGKKGTPWTGRGASSITSPPTSSSPTVSAATARGSPTGRSPSRSPATPESI